LTTSRLQELCVQHGGNSNQEKPATGMNRKSLLRPANLLQVDVESMDLTCAELLRQYLLSNAPTASGIEYARTIKPTAQLPQ
jgi:hypothetical protein